MMRLSRFLRWAGAPSLSIFSRDDRVIECAKFAVSSYYYLLPLAAYLFLSTPVESGPIFEPDWQVSWISWAQLGYEAAHRTVGLAFLAASLIGVLFHRYRAVRVLVFCTILQAHGVDSSTLSVSATWYLHFYTSFILAFAPDIWSVESHTGRRNFLLTVWTAQAAVVFAYTMAGAEKLAYAIVQASYGEVHAFSHAAFANQVAYYVPHNSPAFLAPYAIAFPVLSGIVYKALIIVQLGSWWVMLRPGLHRVWAVLIFMFHVGTYLTLSVSFMPYMLILASLFFASPFVPKSDSWRSIARDLPFADAIRRLMNRS